MGPDGSGWDGMGRLEGPGREVGKGLEGLWKGPGRGVWKGPLPPQKPRQSPYPPCLCFWCDLSRSHLLHIIERCVIVTCVMSFIHDVSVPQGQRPVN